MVNTDPVLTGTDPMALEGEYGPAGSFLRLGANWALFTLAGRRNRELVRVPTWAPLLESMMATPAATSTTTRIPQGLTVWKALYALCQLILPDASEVRKPHAQLDSTDRATGAQRGAVTCLRSWGQSGARLRLESPRRGVLLHVAGRLWLPWHLPQKWLGSGAAAPWRLGCLSPSPVLPTPGISSFSRDSLPLSADVASPSSLHAPGSHKVNANRYMR